ncbi:MAG: hypothetical protein ACLFV6_18440 [Spirulinaceae cyanobacterium]
MSQAKNNCLVTLKQLKFMKKNNVKMDDDLRAEYDLKSLKVRKLGSGRKSFNTTHKQTTNNQQQITENQ